MARKTDDKKGHNLIVRVNDDTKAMIERIAKERGITVSECVREKLNNVMQNNSALQNEIDRLKSENEKLEDELFQKAMNYDAVLDDIRSMAECWGISIDKLLTMIQEELTNGNINVLDGKMVVLDEYLPKAWFSEKVQKQKDNLYDACIARDKNITEVLTAVLVKGMNETAQKIWG